MYEVFTIGGGRFLFNFFNAVAAITQSVEFQFALVFALLVSFIWMLFVIAFKMNDLKPLVIWLFSSVLVMAGLLGPTFTVKITDRIARIESTAYTVANVPAGLAIFASLSSTAGDLITAQFETNFNDVNVPSMRGHGFLFGVELMAKATRMEIHDTLFSQSMSSFIENCLFYDILLGNKSLEGLEMAANTWTYATSNASGARFFELRYKDGDGWDSEIISCAEGLTKPMVGLNERWMNIRTDALGRLVKKAVPGVSNRPISGNRDETFLRTNIASELQQMHVFLIGSSKTAVDTLQDTMMLNAILDEPVNWLSRTNNSAGLSSYINARLDLQTEQSYRAIGRQAKKWVPNLKAVFQCIYYGIFPIAVLMMLSPIGASVVKNYIFGLVWIESWGPLFAIISYIVNSEASDRMQAVVQSVDSSVEDITLASISGIGVVESDISVMAGYLSMSVPFIAIALATGARSFAVLATSTLAVSQEAVGATTTESATGNLSLGNTSFRNDSFFGTTGFKYDTSGNINSGVLNFNDQGDGTLYTEAGGSHGGDPNRTIINVPEQQFGTNISGANQVSSALTQAGDRVQNFAKGFDTRITDGKSAFQGEVSDFSKSLLDGTFISTTTDVGNRANIEESVGTTLEVAERLAASEHVSTKEALDALGAFSLSKQFFGGSAEGQAKFAYNQTASNDISFEAVENALKSTNERDAVTSVVTAGTTESGGTRGEESTSLSDRVDSGFRETIDLTNAQHVAYSDAETFRVAAQM